MKTPYKKNIPTAPLVATVLLITTAVLFSGCTDLEKNDSSDDIAINLNSGKTETSKTDSVINLSDTKVTRKETEPQMKENQYKTIDDFKKIEATQAIF